MTEGTTVADAQEMASRLDISVPHPARRYNDQVARFFDGLEVLDPGVVSTSNWRAEQEPQPRPDESETATDCAVARIP